MATMQATMSGRRPANSLSLGFSESQLRMSMCLAGPSPRCLLVTTDRTSRIDSTSRPALRGAPCKSVTEDSTHLRLITAPSEQTFNVETSETVVATVAGHIPPAPVAPPPTAKTNILFLSIYVGISALAGCVGFSLHPFLLKLTATTWGLEPLDGGFETSFFGLLSIVFGLFAGQSFLFQYERQINIVQELYGEVFALELLVQQTFLTCECTELRQCLATTVRAYMKTELYNPSDMESPFQTGSTYMDILDVLVQMQGREMAVSGLVDSCRQLADAQSRRSAMAAQILPIAHWVFMYAQVVIFVVTFLLFDAAELNGGSANAHTERSLLFGALLALLTLTMQVLHDLANPLVDPGMYSFESALNQRVSFLYTLLDALETQPGSYVPSSVQALKKLGLLVVAKPAAAKVTLGVPRLGRRRRGRMTRSLVFPWSAKV